MPTHARWRLRVVQRHHRGDRGPAVVAFGVFLIGAPLPLPNDLEDLDL